MRTYLRPSSVDRDEARGLFSASVADVLRLVLAAYGRATFRDGKVL